MRYTVCASNKTMDRQTYGNLLASLALSVYVRFVDADFGVRTSQAAVFRASAMSFAAPLPTCNLFGSFIYAVAYVAGVLYTATGIYMLRQHADNPGNMPMSKCMWRLIAGAGCLALPTVAGLLQASVVSSINSSGNVGCVATPAVVVSQGSTSGLDKIFTNLFNNIVNPMQGLLSILSFVVGTFYVAKGLLRASKYGSDPRASSPQTIAAYLIIGSCLLTVGQLADVIMQSLFGLDATNVSQFSGVKWSDGGAADLKTFDLVVTSCLKFVQVIGMISFLRGWMIVKSSVEGSGQATIAQGATHIIGGAMAMNIAGMATILNNTFGLDVLQQ